MRQRDAKANRRERRVEYLKVGRFPFGNLAKPRILGHPDGLVKVVSEAKYDEVLTDENTLDRSLSLRYTLV